MEQHSGFQVDFVQETDLGEELGVSLVPLVSPENAVGETGQQMQQ